MRSRHRWQLVPAFLCMIAVLAFHPIVAQASAWNNAVTYYSTYGNAVTFRATSTTDGLVYYATKASIASTNTRYRTIGWKMTVRNLDGTKLQTIYYKLGGSYMTKVDSRTSGNYEYNLYSLSLNNIKRRLNTKASNALATGDVEITMDACMVVVKKNKAQGAMTDSGPSSGTVYTTYSGISGAESWSATSKSSLKNYFNKSINDLFVSIHTDGDAGISRTAGAGVYCYGTYVTVTAVCKTGYEFEQWSGAVRSAQSSVSFYATESGTCMAVSARKKVDVVFFRNYSQSDTVSNTQLIRYGEGGKSFDPISWTKNGQALLGWSLSSDSTTISYPTSYTVTDTWIVNNSPRLELYAVYRQPVVSTPTPSTSTPSTPTPSTPTPSTPTPSTPTPSTPTSDTPSSETEDTQEADEGTAQGTKKIRVRFISSSYFEDASQNLVSASRGGLAADSKWAVDPSLRTLLRSVLGKT